MKLSSLLIVVLLSAQFYACKEKNKDADIQTAINSRTQSNPSLSSVNAVVENGVVTLTGHCIDEACRSNAEKAVKEIDGVKQVINNIDIAQIRVAPDDELRSKTQEIIDDYDDVQATVNDGVIVLRGQIKRNDLQQLMMNLNTLRPKRIENQLVIK